VVYLSKKSVSGESRFWAFIAYLFGIVGFVIVLLLKKKDAYAFYHAKQSVVLCLSWFVVYMAGLFIPFIGWFIIWPLGNLAMFVLWILGVFNALTGKQKKLPLIGQFGEKINL